MIQSMMQSVFLMLDIAPLSWVGFFLRPVLILALVILAVAVLVMTLKERKSAKRAQQGKAEPSDAEDKTEK